MKFKSTLLLMLSPLITVFSLAQAQTPPNQFDLEYTYATPSDGNFEDSVDIHEGKVGVMLPIRDRKEEGWGLSIGGAFQVNSWRVDSDHELDRQRGGNEDGIDLYKLKLPVMVDFDVAEKMFATLGVTPGIHSDFEDVTSDDWKVEGSGALTYVSSPTLAFTLGAGYTDEFGDSKVLPLGGVRWQATDSLLLNMYFPSPRVQYAFSEGFRVYLFGEPAGGEWNVGDNDEIQVDVQQKGYKFGAGAETKVGEKSWIYLAGGVETNRSVQLAVNENEVFNDDVDLEDTGFVRVGFKITR
jgi:hypothetical protein